MDTTTSGSSPLVPLPSNRVGLLSGSAFKDNHPHFFWDYQEVARSGYLFGNTLLPLPRDLRRDTFFAPRDMEPSLLLSSTVVPPPAPATMYTYLLPPTLSPRPTHWLLLRLWSLVGVFFLAI